MKKRILGLSAALCLLAAALPAQAAESGVVFDPSISSSGKTITMTLSAAPGGATSGQITLTYDPDQLTLSDAAFGDALDAQTAAGDPTSIKTEEAGTVEAGFASLTPIADGEVLVVTFRAADDSSAAAYEVSYEVTEWSAKGRSDLLDGAQEAAGTVSTFADGWHTIDGRDYWYKDGVRQGTTGRGKEIYDKGTQAWYWLEGGEDGAKAVSKDVYLPDSGAGLWAANADGTGKWVRYDKNGHMVKGWDTNKNGAYYFDKVYGTMAKGYVTIDGKEYFFNVITGVLEQELGEVPLNGWKHTAVGDYWYENSIRQGYSVDKSYRGKEIYDPDSKAWYWLDNIDDGKKAVSKDVYLENSGAGPFAETADGIGKWVRYDKDGHMVKGWDLSGVSKYYFDPVYGTMAKGSVTIGGKTYRFDKVTGVLQ